MKERKIHCNYCGKRMHYDGYKWVCSSSRCNCIAYSDPDDPDDEIIYSDDLGEEGYEYESVYDEMMADNDDC